MTLRTFYISSKKWLKKWFFFESYPKNWTLFTMTLRVEPIFSWMGPWELNSFNVTQRCCSLKMTRKIEFFWIWHKDLNFFLNLIQSIFFKKKTKHWTLWKYDSKNWTWFLKKLWLTELNPSFLFNSKNWTLLFNMTQRIEPFIFFNMTHSIEPFFPHWLIEFEPWLIELTPLFI